MWIFRVDGSGGIVDLIRPCKVSVLMTTEPPASFGDLIRRARRDAGLTQEALAERAGISTRAISNLERGINRAPRRDTLALLASALNLSPMDQKQWEQSRVRLSARAGPFLTPDRGDVTNRPPPSFTTIVGREQEQQTLSDCLAAAFSATGQMVLIGGEAGIGKTTVVEDLGKQATTLGALTLTGHCYDLTSTPPYGPWIEVFEDYTRHGAPPPQLSALRGEAANDALESQAALFSEVLLFLSSVASERPLLVVLEDVHWADQASLDLIRYLGRQLNNTALLLAVTYRDDEIARRHPLYQLLPLLIRESRPQRLEVHRLDASMTAALLDERYALNDEDHQRLCLYLQDHAQGNPFYLGELLRALEGQNLLEPCGDTWSLGDLRQVHVPPLIHQVVDQRLDKLGTNARELLEIAAIIGQIVPLDVLLEMCKTGASDSSSVPEQAADSFALGDTTVDQAELLDVIEQVTLAHILQPSTDGVSVGFTHSLTREAVYESIPPLRRRARHGHVGEALAAAQNPDPDEVAYHFQQGGDPRAIDWLIRAGERAQRTYAWGTAAERYQSAARMMEGDPDRARDRALLLNRMGMAMRWTHPAQGAIYLEASAHEAQRAGDRELAAHAQAYHGLLLCFTGNVRHGISTMELAVAELDTIAPGDPQNVAGGVNPAKGALALWLGIVGRFRESRDAANEVFSELTRHGIDVNAVRAGDIGTWDRGSQAAAQVGSSHLALARSFSAMGQPDRAWPMYARSAEIFAALKHMGMVYISNADELRELALPYLCDQLSYREQVAAAAATSWVEAQAAMPGDASKLVTRLPLLVIEGEWDDIPSLAAEFRQAHGNSSMHLRAMVALGTVARAQGNAELAWNQIREGLPFGPNHEPGDREFLSATLLQHLAVSLAVDAGDLSLARDWLEASDRWRDWSGAVLGRAEVALCWASYLEAIGNRVMARRRAEEALTLASHPRQPQVLLTIQRYLGHLATIDGRYTDADNHLTEALTLADRCAAPFERALSLVALADLRNATGQHDDSRALLDEARVICARLRARPTLDRIDALETELAASRGIQPFDAVRLTVREIEILRLVATGKSNRKIADALYLSPRTVERHIANIYVKINVHNKVEATAYALRHLLV